MSTEVLLVGHGSPENLADVPLFVHRIRGGRPASPELLAEVQRRYASIGGRSPLLATMKTQARLLSQSCWMPCHVAMKFWDPGIDEVVGSLAKNPHLDRLVVVPMAPHSCESYQIALDEATERLVRQGIRVPEIVVSGDWGDHPRYLGAWLQGLRGERESISDECKERLAIVFTAHSIPKHVGRSYRKRVEKTTQMLARQVSFGTVLVLTAFQSQGLGEGEWLGPDLATVFDMAQESGAKALMLAPIGFPIDHVETLYDLDIEARALATQRGLALHRVQCPNASPAMIETLAEIVDSLVRARSDTTVEI